MPYPKRIFRAEPGHFNTFTAEHEGAGEAAPTALWRLFGITTFPSRPNLGPCVSVLRELSGRPHASGERRVVRIHSRV
jgi:hypothetical protein